MLEYSRRERLAHYLDKTCNLHYTLTLKLLFRATLLGVDFVFPEKQFFISLMRINYRNLI